MSEALESNVVGRLKIAEEVRAVQQAWLAGLKDGVSGGGHFAICAADEFEEIFQLFGIHTLVVNYWHNLVMASGNGDYYKDLLAERGYDVFGMGPLGYAAAIDPSRAPWGGIPTPMIMLGSTRDEGEFRFMDLWAKEFGCPYYPLDFNLGGPYKRLPPDRWWDKLRTHWEDLVDPDQLEHRIAEVMALIAHLEQLTGQTFSQADLSRSLTLLNRQMDLWTEALEMIADAAVLPVSLQDQLALYQTMWHRGTQRGVDFAQALRDEVAERVATGAQAYPTEEYRLLYWSGDHEPRFHRYIRDQHGAVLVGNLYAACPRLYARDFDPADPIRALCGRNLFLVTHETPDWMLETARRLRCDGIIVREKTYPRATADKKAVDAAGIPYLNVPHLGDDDDLRALLDNFIINEVAPRKAARG